MYGKILSLPLKPVTTCGKSSISAVCQGFEFNFVLIIFAKLFPICLLNLINIFHHISVLCTVKSTWPYVQHISLITKIIIQSNLSIADMLYSGDLVITDTFSWNRPNHGQTLIAVNNGHFYSGHNFLEPREHFLSKFWGKLKTRKMNIFCSYLFDTFAYFFIDASDKILDGGFEPCYDPTVSIKKVINRYLKAKTSSSVHSIASNSNTNTIILKLKKFKCQFTPIKWNVSNDPFQKTIIKNYYNCVFIVFITFFRFTNQWIITRKWIPYFFISVIATAVRTVLENCEVLIEKNWYCNIKRDIYHLLSSCHCIQTQYLFWFKPASNVSHIEFWIFISNVQPFRN